MHVKTSITKCMLVFETKSLRKSMIERQNVLFLYKPPGESNTVLIVLK